MELAGFELSLDRVILVLASLVLVLLVLVLLVFVLLVVNMVQQRRMQADVQQTQAAVQQTQAAVQQTEAAVQQTQQAVQQTEAAVQQTQQAVQKAHVAFEVFKNRVPSQMSDEMFDKVRAATFAILDSDGLPVCCGFFVSACGVALTAAHEAKMWLRKRGKKSVARAATYDNKEFDLEVVERKIGSLDIAVLRLPSAAAAQACLPVPEKTFTEKELSGAPVNLVHGSVAWSAGASPSTFAQDSGSIIASNATTIHYNIGTFKGHSGAALLLRGQQVIGLHSEGFNDLPQEYSEHSPSTAADAARLDLPAVRAAVGRYVKKKSA